MSDNQFTDDSSVIEMTDDENGNEIAIIAMACRFPGADTPETFWQNLVDSTESIQELSDQQLDAAGVDKAEYSRPDYVKRVAPLGDVFQFDRELFKLNARETELLDPQHRLLLECAWETLERAGCIPNDIQAQTGIFAGCGIQNYLNNHVLHQIDDRYLSDRYQAMLLNDKDFLCTRIAYLLGLEGPATTVQTACSTSLVAVHMACQSLIMGECDMALAGASSIQLPQFSGFRHQAEMILSKDGHCRAFDANANGTVMGSGAGMVALKRLDDAMHDNDNILAVIKGTAINNDGHNKVGFTAPGVEGQTRVIEEAIAVANIDSSQIGYVEAHGTGTQLGDPIEVQALTHAFQKTNTEARGNNRCFIGSAKTNIGHLDSAAGIAGLIKSVLSVRNAVIPASLHFEKPNPQIDFTASPFQVATTTEKWPSEYSKRICGVSSFGMGGTNAHVILQQAPVQQKPNLKQQDNRYHLLPLSAATQNNCPAVSDRLVQHLRLNPEMNFNDLSYSLMTGKQALDYRFMVAAKNHADAVAQLQAKSFSQVVKRHDFHRPTVFMFPGQGLQYAGMAYEVYAHYPIFKQCVDQCLQSLPESLSSVLRPLLCKNAMCEGEDADDLTQQLDQTQYSQPALFIVEYALFRLLNSWGIKPDALIGHSLGEYSAACAAGIFSLDDALLLVSERGRLMQTMGAGKMLAARISIDQAKKLTQQQQESNNADKFEIGAINSENDCVFSGTSDALSRLSDTLDNDNIPHRLLKTSHAFHSQAMEPMLQEFKALFDRIVLSPPKIKLISNSTGVELTPNEAISPQYWCEHLRNTVQFESGLATLSSDDQSLFIEVGPGQALSNYAKQRNNIHSQNVIHMLPANHKTNAQKVLLEGLGKLWQSGYDVNWPAYYKGSTAQFITTPTYPFDRKSYYIPAQKHAIKAVQPGGVEKQAISQWLYKPRWYREDLQQTAIKPTSNFLLFVDASSTTLLDNPKASSSNNFIAVSHSGVSGRHDGKPIELAPTLSNDLPSLFSQLDEHEFVADRVVYAWSVGTDELSNSPSKHLVNLAVIINSIAKNNAEARLAVITSNAQDVLGTEELNPDHAALLGPVLVSHQEFSNIQSVLVDIELNNQRDHQLRQVCDIVEAGTETSLIALRGTHSWACEWTPFKLPSAEPAPASEESSETEESSKTRVWLITGGVGKIGLTVAEALSRKSKLHLVLTCRQALPPSSEWPNLIASADTKTALKLKLTILEKIRNQTASLTIAPVNISDETNMRDLLTTTVQKFGKIDTLIHAAADISDSSQKSISPDMLSDYKALTTAKLEGTRVLATLVNKSLVKNVVCMSSLSTILGGYQMSAYVSGNLAMDALVKQIAKTSDVRWTTLGWDAWIFDSSVTQNHSQLIQNAIRPDDGLTVLENILNAQHHVHLAVSTSDLQQRLSQISQPQTTATIVATNSNNEALDDTHTHTDIVIGIFKQLLGIETVEPTDNFFELGGNSLIATQVISRIRDHFDVHLTLANFFDFSTAAEITQYMTDQLSLTNTSLASSPANEKRVEIEI